MAEERGVEMAKEILTFRTVFFCGKKIVSYAQRPAQTDGE